MQVKVLCLTALAAGAIALPAAAQTAGGLTDPMTYLRGSYVELEGGGSFQGATTEFNSPAGQIANQGSGHFRAGYLGGAILGHDLAPGVGVELEGLYLNNEYNTATNITQGVYGHTSTYGGLANLKFSLPFDYHVTPRFALVPYAAAGAGYGQVRYHTGAGGVDFVNDTQDGFMWQAKAGVEVKTGTPVSLDIGYRYLETPDYHQDFLGAGGGSSFEMRSHAQVATVGLRYTF
jgi:opacity protein-like surface antigen